MFKKVSVLFVIFNFAFSAPETNSRANNEPVLAPVPDEILPIYPTTTSDPVTHPRDSPNWTQPPGPTDEKSREFWQSSGQQILRESLKKKMNTKVAKNLIILVADGMSIPTQMATRMYMGGEEKVLSFEKFPYVGLSKTYCVNYQVADSGCTATAFLSGIKTNFGVLSMSAHVPLRNCSAESDEKNHVDSIFKFAQDAGKATGVVTNTRITHATPAAAYAKSASRYWENNAQTPAGCRDMALQLVHGEIGRKLDVILGGGFREFLPNNSADPLGRRGRRTDNRDLIREWMLSHRRAFVVHDRASLKAFQHRYFDKLLGLFSDSHMQYHLLNDKVVEPTLMEMSQKALQMVSKNPNGYVLLIESGRIDHGHHETKAKLALEETKHFQEVVEYIRSQVDESETLIVATADHSHTMSVSGYPIRKSNILSVGDFSREDSLPYFTLSYANGMGFFDHFNESGRVNPLDMDYEDPHFMQPTTVPLYEETHGGDDVGVFAVGPHSHLFTGLYEQHYIAHAMMYATCLGPESYLKAPACNSCTHLKFSIGLLAFSASILVMK